MEQVKKIRKKRKPMSEEQRAAAGERLKLAREKRMNCLLYTSPSPRD